VVTVWADPPYADVDGDGKLEIVLSMFNSQGEGAWLLRVYDALTGVLKYQLPRAIAVSCADVDGDGGTEIPRQPVRRSHQDRAAGSLSAQGGQGQK